MAHYIDADKLIEEIEKLYNEAKSKPYTGEVEGEMDAYDRVLSIIDSMQEKPKEPVYEDLEKEIERWIYNPYFDLDGVAVKGATHYLTVEDVADIARHFANWQKQQMMKDAITAKVLPTNLDETEFCLDDYDEVNKITALVKEGNLKIGDKVKVIFFKEE